MVRIGLLGAAKIAPAAIIGPVRDRAGAEILAVAARDGDRANAFAKAHDIPDGLEGYDALLARDDIDLVYNGLPPSRHADLTIAALEAGKAVLCEKPFAMNANEARQMASAAARTGQVLIEAYHYRFHPAFQRVLDIVEGGRIGAVTEFEAAFTVDIPYKPGELRHEASLGGGAMMDLGCYPLHWARTLLGGEPDIIRATAIEDRPGVDVTMTAELDMSGIPARLHTSMAKGVERGAHLTITGEMGRLHMVNPLAPHLGHAITVDADGHASTETVDGETTYHHQIDHVLEVMTGRAAALTGGEDAVCQMQAIDAIYTAAGMVPRGT